MNTSGGSNRDVAGHARKKLFWPAFGLIVTYLTSLAFGLIVTYLTSLAFGLIVTYLTSLAFGLIVTYLTSLAFALGWMGVTAWVFFAEADAEAAMPLDLSEALPEIVGLGILQIPSVFALLGAILMLNARSRGLCIATCIISLIACPATRWPLYIFAIPFAIWGLVVLNDPLVRMALEPCDRDEVSYARRKLLGPAIGLIVTGSISLAYLLMVLGLSTLVLLMGSAGAMRSTTHLSVEQEIIAGMVWNALMLIVSFAILFGAIGMLRTRHRRLAFTACILAVVPCIGPCYVFGLPVGIWGLVALRDPKVRLAFRYSRNTK